MINLLKGLFLFFNLKNTCSGGEEDFATTASDKVVEGGLNVEQ